MHDAATGSTAHRPVLHSLEDGPHAVVIGSGFSGLEAAVRLGARGYRVTVLEKLDAPGGRAYVRQIDGFTFDAGPTVITAPLLFEKLWELAGRRFADEIEMRPVTPFYRIRFHDGRFFDYTGTARPCDDRWQGSRRATWRATTDSSQ